MKSTNLKAVFLSFFLLFHLYSFSINIKNVYQPNPDITVNWGSLMPRFIGDWETNSDLLNMQVKWQNGFTYFRFKAYLIKGNDTIIETVPFIDLDSMDNGTNMFTTAQFLKRDFSMVDSAYIEDISDGGKIPSGQYTFTVVFYDTFLIKEIYPPITINFDVTEYEAVTLVRPFDSKSIPIQYLDSLTFTWLDVVPKYPGLLSYQIKICEVLPYQQPHEAFEQNTPLISTIVNTQKFYLTGINFLQKLDTGKCYVWAVQSFDFVTRDTVGSNKGWSTEYIFKISNNINDFESWMSERTSTGLCFPDNFEKDILGWRYYTGKHEKVASFKTSFPSFHKDPVPQFHNSITSGLDHFSGLNQLAPGGGLHCIKLGDSFFVAPYLLKSEASMITKNFDVNDQNKIFIGSVATVLEHGHDNSTWESFFQTECYRFNFRSRWNIITSRVIKPNVFQMILSSDRNPYLMKSSVNSNVYYSDWNCIKYDYTRFKNKNVLLTMASGGCADMGHFGYSYVDFCTYTTPLLQNSLHPSYCITDTIILRFPVNINVTEAVITVDKVDVNGNPEFGKEIGQGYAGKVTDTFNISKRYNYKMECGTYKVRYCISNQCTDRNCPEVTFTVYCPGSGLAGPDQCCKDGGAPGDTIKLGLPAIPGKIYHWTPTPDLANLNSSQATFTQSVGMHFPIKLYLEVTDTPGNCKSKDSVYIFCGPPSITINLGQSDACGVKLYATGNSFSKVDWYSFKYSNGQVSDYKFQKTDSAIYITEKDVFVIAKVANLCGSASDTFYVPGGRILKGEFPTIAYPRTLRVTQPGQEIYFYEIGKATGDIFAYNATHYMLFIKGHDGSMMQVKDVTNMNGFYNGEISWDGTNDLGQDLEAGEYGVYILLGNCDHPILSNGQFHNKFKLIVDPSECITTGPGCFGSHIFQKKKCDKDCTSDPAIMNPSGKRMCFMELQKDLIEMDISIIR